MSSPLIRFPRLAAGAEIDRFRIAARPELRGMLHGIIGILTDGRMEGMDTTTWLGFAGLCPAAVCSVVGNLIFQLFGITLPTLQVAGGIVVFTIGYKMLQGSVADSHTTSDKDIDSSREARLSVAVSPLGIPLLAGPGTIATAMSFAAAGRLHLAVSVAPSGLICIVTYPCFTPAERLVRFLTGRKNFGW